MPLGQRIAHMPPERRLRIQDLRDELFVGTSDVLPKVSGNVGVPALPARVGDGADDGGALLNPSRCDEVDRLVDEADRSPVTGALSPA
jgi:hypothetical protein